MRKDRDPYTQQMRCRVDMEVMNVRLSTYSGHAPFGRALLWAAIVLLPGYLHAQTQPAEAVASETVPSLRLSGYGTLSLASVKTPSGWWYGRDISYVKDFSDEITAEIDSRLGLQANLTLTPQLELVAQAVLRKRATPDIFTGEAVEWAFAQWRPTPAWSVRAGRFSPDLFLHADVRSLDFSQPWVRPSAEFYGWMPFISLNGVDASYEWTSDQANWKARVYVGMAKNSTTVGTLGEYADSRMDNILGLTLSREEDGLLLKASYLQADLLRQPRLQPLAQGLQALEQLPLPAIAAEAKALESDIAPYGVSRYFSMGMQLDQGPWLAHMELAAMAVQHGRFDAVRSYASLAYRWKRYTVFGMAGISHPLRDAAEAPQQWAAELAPVIGPEAAAQAAMLGAFSAMTANRSRFDRHTFSLGGRWDIHPQAALKLQYDQMHVAPNGSGGWDHSYDQGGVTRIWTVALNFIF